MRLTYCQIEGGNFGDDLNPWLWPRVAPGLCDDDLAVELLGIGSILSNTHQPGPRRVVFGSGAGYKRPPVIDENWKIYCVRGPKTAAALKIDASLAVTDAAALVAAVELPPVETSNCISYMPHHQSAEVGDWRSVCQLAGVHYIDSRGGVSSVAATIDQIRQSKLLITEALHGAVVADALRVPWIAVRAYGHILPFKWHDWAQSLGISYRPCLLPTLWQQQMTIPSRARSMFKRTLGYLPGGKEKWRWSPVRLHGSRRVEAIAQRLSQIARTDAGQLSDDRVHDRVVTQLVEKLETMIRDFAPKRRFSLQLIA